MAIGDIPKFPREYRPRGDRLIRMILEDQISKKDVFNNVVSVLGYVSAGSSGIEINGSFGSFKIDSDDFGALVESADKMLDILPGLLKGVIGHELFIRVGDEVTRLSIKFPPKKVPSSLREVKETNIPSFEMPASEVNGKPCGFLFEFFASYIGNHFPPNGKLVNVKIRRAEELVGWLGEGWEFLENMLDVAIPSLQLTSKKSMDRLGKSYTAFWDELLRKCGV